MPTPKDLVTNIEQTSSEGEQNALSAAAHKALLFYYGILATAIEESYGLASRLIEHTEVVEKEGRKRVNEMMSKRNEKARRTEKEGAEEARQAKSRLAFSSMADIEGLSEKITRLSHQIDELAKPKS